MAELVVSTRTQLHDRMCANFKARVIDAGLSTSPDIGPDSYESKLFQAIGDNLALMSNNAVVVARGVSLQDMDMTQLTAFGNTPGIDTPPLAAVGAFGYIQITTATGGTSLDTTRQWKNAATNLVYQVVTAGTYANQATVPVQCTTGGIATNVDPGVILTAVTTAPGCYPTAPVVAQPNGLGLAGGREAEQEGTYRQRLSNAIAHPAAMGNVDQIVAAAENSAGHGVPVQKAFAYPQIMGPGTCAVAIMLTPASATGSVFPSSGQLNSVGAFIDAQESIDDGIFMLEMLARNVDPILKIQWTRSSSGWADVAPWPTIAATPSAVAKITSATSPTSFVISTFTGYAQPVNGQRLAIWNQSTGQFVRKTIASFSGTGPWTITVDVTGNASDITYTPATGQFVMPWSDNINDLVPVMLAYFAAFGPGENAPDGFSPTTSDRCWRHPLQDVGEWPTILDARVANVLNEVASVSYATYVTDLGTGSYSTTTTKTNVGTQTVSVYRLTLDDIAFYPG